MMNGAKAEFDDAHWGLSTGSWTQKTTRAVTTDGTAVAELSVPSWWRYNGTATVLGKKYGIAGANWSGTRFIITDTSGRDVAHMRLRYLWRTAAEVEIIDPSADRNAVFLLAALIFFRTKVIEMSTAAASAAGTAVVFTN